MKRILFAFSVLLSLTLSANTRYYRVMFRGNPGTSACIGWDQVSGNNPRLHYSITDHGTNVNAYENTASVSRSVSYRGMDNNFVRLTGLQPNTKYFFVISDSQGKSKRYWFKTCPNTSDERLSFIAGGDSRNNRTPRQRANRLVAKLKPHAVFFGGDMTNSDNDSQWDEWMDDWQESIHSNGRIIPLVVARGNHEKSNNVMRNLFDVPTSDVYYALNFGGNLVRAYTLNTEISISGDQTTWLRNDLRSTGNSVCWKMAQYHKPMRPHVENKAEGNSQYSNWAQLFQDHGVKLVMESDAHTVKTTWPVIPSTRNGSDEGFIRDDEEGTVYVGEGCWGAPTRSNNDNKTWTRNSGEFNQFKWIFVDEQKIEIRTIKIDNESSVGEVSDNDIFTPPANIDIWSPSKGAVVKILKPNTGNILPQVSITSPANNSYYSEAQFVSISADASDADGSIDRVEFFVDGVLTSTDNNATYTANIYLEDGSHKITARAYDNQGVYTEDEISLSVGVFSETLSIQVASGVDDSEEAENGDIDMGSSDLELVYEARLDRGNQHVGVRFRNLAIPEGATITEAYIQFTVDELESGNTNLRVYGQAANNASVFTEAAFDISSRNLTNTYETWSPSGPWAIGDATADQQTPDLSAIIQEIVDRPGWNTGNAIAFIINGTGARTAESYDGAPNKAPVLHVSYEISDDVTSIFDTEESTTQIYPTRTSDYFTISDESDFSWSVTNLSGQTILMGEGTLTEEINISALQRGNYLVTIFSENRRTVKRITKL